MPQSPMLIDETERCYGMHRHVCSLAGEYLVEDEIGEGAHSRVVSAKHLATGEQRALKIITKDAKMSQEDTNEGYIMSLLSHDNIVKAYEVLETRSEIAIALELMHTDLYFTLYRKRRFTEDETKEVCLAVTTVLEYLHSNDLVHRDIKLENILVGKNGGYKVGDFGYSKMVTSANKPMGTSFYQSPEVLQAQQNGTLISAEEAKAADIFALGVLLFYLVCGRPPFIGKVWPPAERVKLHRMMTTQPVSPADSRFPASLSNEARTFIASLLSPSHSDRPSISTAITHPWMSQAEQHFKIPVAPTAGHLSASSLVDCPA
eukprot:TRINITY_DN2114_c1_g1_i1.p1 TRINITY_DN2114_c1_g1~~TRINITY_DN2114_c1_g1_i1.p1  ORF type:complete len:318 (+),score=57.59 TRINITY_DN2114_c1_g1_i1:80-1033(+)